MCLSTIYSKKKIDKFKKRIPPEGIKVYKVARVSCGRYYPMCQHTNISFEPGLNEANTTIIIRTNNYDTYESGFHFFTNKKMQKSIRKGKVIILMKLLNV